MNDTEQTSLFDRFMNSFVLHNEYYEGFPDEGVKHVYDLGEFREEELTVKMDDPNEIDEADPSLFRRYAIDVWGNLCLLDAFTKVVLYNHQEKLFVEVI